MHDLSLTLEFQIENKKKCLLKKIQTIAKVNISNIRILFRFTTTVTVGFEGQ